MRPWLEAKIESGKIPGLQWIDKNKKIFKVPWKHGGKHDWNEQDSQIFKVNFRENLTRKKFFYKKSRLSTSRQIILKAVDACPVGSLLPVHLYFLIISEFVSFLLFMCLFY